MACLALNVALEIKFIRTAVASSRETRPTHCLVYLRLSAVNFF
ncbi:hypothetical protein FDUTEX481_08707 [Tolypothrix sp. PCC 7601]|nr:hypothetical protein FDUTEX481_08707 [Tolypothrix sp. PCC 7601]